MRVIAYIFCSGEGTRLRPLTNNIPKPLLPIADDFSILDLTIRHLLNNGINRIIINYSYGKMLFRKIVRCYSEEARIHLIEEKKASGHGGALIRGRAFYKNYQTILAINGDSYIELNLVRFISHHNKMKNGISMLSNPKDKSLSKDLLIDAGNSVVGVAGDEDKLLAMNPSKKFKRVNFAGVFAISVPNLLRIISDYFEGIPDYCPLHGDAGLLNFFRLENFPVKCFQKIYINRYVSMNTREEYRLASTKLKDLIYKLDDLD